MFLLAAKLARWSFSVANQVEQNRSWCTTFPGKFTLFPSTGDIKAHNAVLSALITDSNKSLLHLVAPAVRTVFLLASGERMTRETMQASRLLHRHAYLCSAVFSTEERN